MTDLIAGVQKSEVGESAVLSSLVVVDDVAYFGSTGRNLYPLQ
jgi:hypothetical protein